MLEAVLWGASMTLIMGWLARSRKHRPRGAPAGLLIQPVATLIVGIVCSAFFLGLAIISNTIGKNSTTTLWTTLLFVGFALAGVPMISEYFLARHHVDQTGVQYGRMFGRGGSFRWSEVRRIRFSNSMKWFRLEMSSGVVVRISAMLIGLPEFATYVLAKVPSALIDEDAHQLLLQTRQGNLPRIWG